jgi:hypothetical protein
VLFLPRSNNYHAFDEIDGTFCRRSRSNDVGKSRPRRGDGMTMNEVTHPGLNLDASDQKVRKQVGMCRLLGFLDE